MPDRTEDDTKPTGKRSWDEPVSDPSPATDLKTEQTEAPSKQDGEDSRPSTATPHHAAPADEPAATASRAANAPQRPARVDNTRPTGSPDQRRTYEAGDLIDQLTPTERERSRSGWRSRFGLKPSVKELDEQRDGELAKTEFGRPITIMVANPKGGTGKTPISLLLAAAFGTQRGGGVVAWDNNELRGTMPHRSHSEHRMNVHDVLDHESELMDAYSGLTDLAQYLNHQANGTFYTLGSAQNSGHVISQKDFEKVHDLFCRYFQVMVVDTGNNEAAPNWIAAANVADVLVVPIKWRQDSLIPAARMMETLQEAHPGLLERTVIVATNGPADTQKDVKRNGAAWFGSSHPITEIPVDAHIAEGGEIDWAKLQSGTRRAALRMAAEVAKRLKDS